MKKSDIALKNFENKCNCCQSVFLAFCEDYGLDKNQALKVASGFGGGMGSLQEVCGALTGAFMTLSLKYYSNKSLCYDKIKEMSDSFREIHGDITCLKLLDCDLNSETNPDVINKAKEICPFLVRTSADIAENILKSDTNN